MPFGESVLIGYDKATLRTLVVDLKFNLPSEWWESLRNKRPSRVIKERKGGH